MSLRNFVQALRIPGLIVSSIVAGWLVLSAFGFAVTSPGEQLETHAVQHIQIESSLEAIVANLNTISSDLGTLVRLRCIESDPVTIQLSGLDCS